MPRRSSDSFLNSIVRLEKRCLRQAASVLASSFLDDPVVSYFLPDRATREAGACHKFMYLLHLGLIYGAVDAVSDEMKAILIWYPPNAGPVALASKIRAGYLTLPFTMGPSAFRRFYRYGRVAGEATARHKRVSDYYVSVIAVSPSHQGKGYASLLLERLSSKIDFSKHRIYLETSNPKNIPFYEHMGFVVLEEASLPNSDVKVWPMARST